MQDRILELTPAEARIVYDYLHAYFKKLNKKKSKPPKKWAALSK